MQSYFQGFLSLLFQPNCPLCERPAKKILCLYCQRKLESQRIEQPQQFWRGDLPLLVWGNYGGLLKSAIASLKYNNHPEIAQPLGYELGKAWLKSSLSTQKLTVIPIPMYSQKQKERGFNQAELIGQSFCQYTGLKLQPQGLIRIRETKAQFGLGGAEREQNLQNAFRVGKSLQNRRNQSPILLIDDIYTTGATARNAASVLRKQGISVLGIVAVASTMKRN